MPLVLKRAPFRLKTCFRTQEVFGLRKHTSQCCLVFVQACRSLNPPEPIKHREETQAGVSKRRKTSPSAVQGLPGPTKWEGLLLGQKHLSYDQGPRHGMVTTSPSLPRP